MTEQAVSTDWQNPKVGSKKRVALWLVHEVGLGNIFTKNQLREAFPDVAQIDRRMRDLRPHGWQIDTNREDSSLEANEQKFVRQGEPVWIPGAVPKKAPNSIGAAQRREVLQRDDHMCRSCGIGPGERYPDLAGTAQLDIARRQVQIGHGQQVVQLVVECTRCRIGNGDNIVDVQAFLERANQLPAIERRIFADWLRKGARDFGEAERLWTIYRALPADTRDQVAEAFS